MMGRLSPLNLSANVGSWPRLDFILIYISTRQSYLKVLLGVDICLHPPPQPSGNHGYTRRQHDLSLILTGTFPLPCKSPVAPLSLLMRGGSPNTLKVMQVKLFLLALMLWWAYFCRGMQCGDQFFSTRIAWECLGNLHSDGKKFNVAYGGRGTAFLSICCHKYVSSAGLSVLHKPRPAAIYLMVQGPLAACHPLVLTCVVTCKEFKEGFPMQISVSPLEICSPRMLEGSWTCWGVLWKKTFNHTVLSQPDFLTFQALHTL